MQHRTRIKICGIRHPVDASFAADAGADAIGLIFHSASPRMVALDEAIAIRKSLPPYVSTVALFVDADRDTVERVADTLQPSLLQFHGRETPDFCRWFGRPYVKAVGVGAATTAEDLVKSTYDFHEAAAILLDTQKSGGQGGGGTGQVFDWSVIPSSISSRIVLAGGLKPENVANAVRSVRPWAVDVASGVEGPEKGRKDPSKITAFIEQVRVADADV